MMVWLSMVVGVSTLVGCTHAGVKRGRFNVERGLKTTQHTHWWRSNLRENLVKDQAVGSKKIS